LRRFRERGGKKKEHRQIDGERGGSVKKGRGRKKKTGTGINIRGTLGRLGEDRTRGGYGRALWLEKKRNRGGGGGGKIGGERMNKNVE